MNTGIKANYDLLEEQQKEFSNNGEILRNIFSISIKHPFLSLIFALCFGVSTNALFEFCGFLTGKSQYDFFSLMVIVGGLFAVQVIIFFRVKWLHKDLFVATPINQKKMLITLVSPRANFRETPSSAVYEAMLYNLSGHAAINSLQKVILITSESQDVKNTANDLKTYIEAGNREAIIKGISIENRTFTDIQKQIELIFSELRKDYKPHEILADYTGANKEMSIALLMTSEKELILPVYLKNAITTNHSKYY